MTDLARSERKKGTEIDRYANINPELVIYTLRRKDKREYSINKIQADAIAALPMGEKVRLPNGDYVNTTEIALMEVDTKETTKRIWGTLPQNKSDKPYGPICSHEQFMAMCEAKAKVHQGFADIFNGWKAKKGGMFSGILSRIAEAAPPEDPAIARIDPRYQMAGF